MSMRRLNALTILVGLALPTWAQDDPGAERALLASALDVLTEQAMSEDLVPTYKEIHARAWQLGDAETAHGAIHRIMTWWEEQAGHETREVADRLFDLGERLEERGDWASARRSHLRALALREEALGLIHPDIARSLEQLGSLSLTTEDLEAARDYFERSVAMREAIVPLDRSRLGLALNSLAHVLGKLGDLTRALEVCRRGLALREEARGPEDRLVAYNLTTLGNLLRKRGEFGAAREALVRALTIREAHYGEADIRLMSTLGGLASLERETGALAEARRLQERALAIGEATHGPDHLDLTSTLNNLGNIYQDLGELDLARSCLERVSTIREAAFGPDHPEIAHPLGNLAVVHRSLGDHERARSLLRRALVIAESTPGYERAHLSDMLTLLGVVLTEMGALREARPSLERGLVIRHEIYGDEHMRVAESLHALGVLFATLGGADDEARSCFDRALRTFESSAGSSHHKVAGILDGLATLDIEAGDLRAARQRYERALAVREDRLGADHVHTCLSLMNLALLDLDEGDVEAAWARSLQLMERGAHLERHLLTLTEDEAFRFLALWRDVRDVVLAAAQARGAWREGLQFVLESKGRVSRLTLQSRIRLRDQHDPEALARAEELGRIQARLSRMSMTLDAGDRAAHQARLDSLTAARDALERELRRGQHFGGAPRVTLEGVLERLPARSALVTLLEHRAHAGSAGPGESPTGRWSERRVSAWIARAGSGDVVHVDLGAAAAIEAAIRGHLETVAARGRVRGSALAPFEVRDPGRETDLSRMLWQPLEEHLEGIATVFLSPDAALGTLPFETLRGETGRFVIEDRAVVYVSHGVPLIEVSDEAPGMEASLLAAGNVAFDSADALPTPSKTASERPRGEMGGEMGGAAFGRWSALPATVHETESVLASHVAAHGRDAPRLWLQGAEATEERLKAEMPHHATLHLATHGYFRPEGLPSMWDQALASVGGERGGWEARTNPRLTGLHPGLLSGLVLAGANRLPEDDAFGSEGPVRDDGYLTASEVTLLDLSRVDLVVLSACETGLGRPQSGEGMLGLRRAFHMAGADTVVSSLWAIEDDSTARLMQSFYANLFREGMGRHEALRAAQLEMLARNREEHGEGLPSTWGAFVLSGEWR